jgi:putative beta-barrel porin
MKQLFFVVFLVLFIFDASAQRKNLNRAEGQLFQNDTTSFNKEVQIKLDGLTKYTDYKIISIDNDTTVVDTTLTLKKDFIFNYLRKDNFELLAFHNQGQTYTKLGYNFENNSLLPLIGANAKQFNYYKVEDISYYNVPTPTSEILYRSGLEQGQVLDAFLTMNTSPLFNFSFAYKGLRSLGKYRYSLASHGNFRTTFNYHTKNKKYYTRGHFSSFDLLNNENGGLISQSIAYFENNDPNYIDRARLDVNFTDAENILEGKRYYIEQQLMLFSKKNKIKKHNTNISNNILKSNSIFNKIEILKDSLINHTKIDSLTKKTAIIKPDSTTLNIKLKTGSLAKKTLNPKRKTTIKSDSVALKNILKTISLIKKDSVVKLDSISNNYIMRIDSLTKVVSEINIDSTQFKALNEKSNIELKLGHTFMYETKHYRFTQASANSIFGDAFESSISDHTSYQKLDNQISLQLNSPYTGSLKAKINYYQYNYHYNSIIFYDSLTIADKLKGNAIVAGADWKTKFGNIYLNADATSIIAGDITGSTIKASVMVKKDSVYSFRGYAELTSKTPDFNKLLFQSDYKDYNWKNDFNNEKISTIGIEFTSSKWGNLKASYNLIDNYTYFDTISKPIQASETLNYLKVKASKAISYKKFTLDNTVMYQNVLEGESFFRVPQIVTRNTLYFSSYLFKGKPMFLQTGVTFKYFTAFKANAYNPLLSEFVLQNDTEIGNFPVLDFFANAQIRRTRIFLKVENLSAGFTGRNYYSAPNYPYRDLTVRFGIVWNWFI